MFGRFQPPTKGHERLFTFALQMAQQEDADVAVFLSNTQDTKGNPLSHAEKAKVITTSVPKLLIGPATVMSPYEALFWAKDQGYTRIILLVGGDRLTDFKRLATTWQGKVEGDNIPDVLVRGIPRTGAMSADIISGSTLRKLAQQDKYNTFKARFMGNVPESLVRRMFLAIQTRLGKLSEQPMFTRFSTFHDQLSEAEDGFMLREVDAAASVPPDEEVVSADELAGKIAAQGGSLDAREAERAPSDSPENQSLLVIHPKPRIKRELINAYQEKQAAHFDNDK